MKILITGIAGFIGSSLGLELLKQKHQIVGLDNFDPFYPKKIKEKNLEDLLEFDHFSFYEIDFRKNNELDILPNDIDAVVHLAAKAGVQPSLKAPISFVETNILGSVQVLEWMRKSNIKKLVFASSSSIYGNNKKTPFSEDDIVDFPISPYAATKKSCELFNHVYHELYHFDIINLRFFTVYGPKPRPDLAIHKFLSKAKNNETIELYGDGSTGRDYTYIDDTVSGIIQSIHFVLDNKSVYKIFNLGNNYPVKLLDLVSEMNNNLETPLKTKHVEMKKGDVDITFADISKAKKTLKYSPKISFSDGIKKFFNWYDNKK